jgi:hypothetical protein
MKKASELRKISDEAKNRQKEEDARILELLEEAAKEKLSQILPEIEMALDKAALGGDYNLRSFSFGKHYSKREEAEELLRVDKVAANLLSKILRECELNVSIGQSGAAGDTETEWISEVYIDVWWSLTT